MEKWRVEKMAKRWGCHFYEMQNRPDNFPLLSPCSDEHIFLQTLTEEQAQQVKEKGKRIYLRSKSSQGRGKWSAEVRRRYNIKTRESILRDARRK